MSGHGYFAGRFVDLALAYSLGEGTRPAASCKFKLDECSGSRRDFHLGLFYAVAASTACRVTDRWFPPHFSLFSTFGIDGWSAEVSCPIVSQPLWPACWIDTPDWSSSSVSRAVQDAWGVYRDELGVVPPGVVIALRDAVSRSSVDDFWSIWSKNAEAGLFRAYLSGRWSHCSWQLCFSFHPALLFESVMSVVWSRQLVVQRTFGTTVSIVDSASPVRSEGALCECHELKANFDASLSQSCVLCIQDK